MNLWVSADLGCVWLILAGFTYMCRCQRLEIGQRESAGVTYVSHGSTGAIQICLHCGGGKSVYVLMVMVTGKTEQEGVSAVL